MNPLDELAHRTCVLEACDKTPFRRKVRILQSLWRIAQGFEPGIHRDRPLGSRLPMPQAKETLANFLTDDIRQIVRQEVLDPVRSRDKLFAKPRIFCDLLSSQPLALNLFAPLKLDLDLATRVFGHLTGDCFGTVSGIEFEHSPGRGDNGFLGDRSAFDVFVELEHKGIRAFIGIEVKYHEDLSDQPATHKPRYDQVAKAMGCFRPESLASLKNRPLQQLWRDHLLAGSLLQARNIPYREGLFVVAYPEANQACGGALASYRQGLSCTATFDAWTLESIVQAILRFADRPWADLFYGRYLDFAKVERRVAALG